MLARQSILIVEDDEQDAGLIEEAFQSAGIQYPREYVQTAWQAKELLTRAAESQNRHHYLPCMIILDLALPDQSGLELLKFIRSHAPLRRIPAIVLTSSASERDVLAAYRLGSNSFMTKSFTMQELSESIHWFCQYWFNTVKLPPAS